MKVLRTVLFAAALGVSSTPAHAALIGMSGGDYDPPPITDITFQDLNSCAVGNFDLPSSFACAFYEFADVDDFEGDDPVSSIDFRLLDGLGNYIAFETLTLDNQRSDLTGALILSPLFADGVTFRLSGGIEQAIYPCGECELPALAFFAGPDDGDEPHSAADVANFSLSVVGVNGQANPGATAVPEPATLLLMGPAAAALLMRRRRKTG